MSQDEQDSRRSSVATDKDDTSRRSSVAQKDEKSESRRTSVAEKLSKKVRLMLVDSFFPFPIVSFFVNVTVKKKLLAKKQANAANAHKSAATVQHRFVNFHHCENDI